MRDRAQPLIPLEVERIRFAIPTAGDMVLTGLFCYAGLRPEDALALRWSDVRPGVLVVDRAWTHGELKPTKTYQRPRSGPGRPGVPEPVTRCPLTSD
jgi:integrase